MIGQLARTIVFQLSEDLIILNNMLVFPQFFLFIICAFVIVPLHASKDMRKLLEYIGVFGSYSKAFEGLTERDCERLVNQARKEPDGKQILILAYRACEPCKIGKNFLNSENWKRTLKDSLLSCYEDQPEPDRDRYRLFFKWIHKADPDDFFKAIEPEVFLGETWFAERAIVKYLGSDEMARFVAAEKKLKNVDIPKVNCSFSFKTCAIALDSWVLNQEEDRASDLSDYGADRGQKPIIKEITRTRGPDDGRDQKWNKPGKKRKDAKEGNGDEEESSNVISVEEWVPVDEDEAQSHSASLSPTESSESSDEEESIMASSAAYSQEDEKSKVDAESSDQRESSSEPENSNKKESSESVSERKKATSKSSGKGRRGSVSEESPQSESLDNDSEDEMTKSESDDASQSSEDDSNDEESSISEEAMEKSDSHDDASADSDDDIGSEDLLQETSSSAGEDSDRPKPHKHPKAEKPKKKPINKTQPKKESSSESFSDKDSSSMEESSEISEPQESTKAEQTRNKRKRRTQSESDETSDENSSQGNDSSSEEISRRSKPRKPTKKKRADSESLSNDDISDSEEAPRRPRPQVHFKSGKIKKNFTKQKRRNKREKSNSAEQSHSSPPYKFSEAY